METHRLDTSHSRTVSLAISSSMAYDVTHDGVCGPLFGSVGCFLFFGSWCRFSHSFVCDCRGVMLLLFHGDPLLAAPRGKHEDSRCSSGCIEQMNNAVSLDFAQFAKVDAEAFDDVHGWCCRGAYQHSRRAILINLFCGRGLGSGTRRSFAACDVPCFLLATAAQIPGGCCPEVAL